MSYTYDIYLNFNNVPYDFYDWEKNDTIIHIKKIPIFKISVDNFKNILKYNINIDKSFINRVHNKTEIWNNKKNMLTCALFTDELNIIAIMFNNDGYEIKRSFLQIDEELEILDSVDEVDKINIKIKFSSRIKYNIKTRRQLRNEKFILNELNSIKDDRLKYIYYECFGKNEKNKDLIIKKIKKMPKNSLTYQKLYNILKLTK